MDKRTFDAIVIGENIFSKVAAGMPPGRAAIDGANEVAVPVVAAVLTTCAAFLPLMFIPGRIGSFLGVLPIVVLSALGVSLIEAFLILPSHLSHQRAPGKGPRFPRLHELFRPIRLRRRRRREARCG